MKRFHYIFTVFVFFTMISLSAGRVSAENKSGVEPHVISLPDGPGTISGLGESFEPNLNTGSSNYRVAIEVCGGAGGFQPQPSFAYDSGFGNGPLGLGWRLDMPFLQRQTDKGLPRYDISDTFIFGSLGELVALGNGEYRLKTEGAFIRFVKQGDIWHVWDKDGTKHVYGEIPAHRVSGPRGIFKWMPSRSVDPNNNIIEYRYLQHDRNCYIEEVRYAFTGSGTYRSVLFEYEDRVDAISDYKSRFRVSTAKRLKQVSVLSEGSLVRKYVLFYEPAPGTAISRLSKITQTGMDGLSELPSLSFQYTSPDISLGEMVSMNNPPGVSVSSSEADLVDIDGDSLPDICHTPAGGHEFFINKGNNSWESVAANPLLSPGHHLSTNGVMMADLDGDGDADLVFDTFPEFGYFKNAGKPWERESDRVDYAVSPPFSLEDQNTRLVELNNDGLVDVVRSDMGRFLCYLNHDETPWAESFETANPGLNLSDKRVILADLNGDKLNDLLYVDAWGSTYFMPSLGYGEFGAEVFMGGSPFLPEAKILDGTVLSMDANSDGLSDLVSVDSGQVTVWLNQGNESFGPAIDIFGTPFFDWGVPALRQADMNGDGCKDLLFSIANAPENEQYRFFSFCKNTYPNLLSDVDNGLGSLTRISYKSSTAYYLEAEEQGVPWETILPFPVRVVSRKVVTDKNSGQEYATSYVYRDGYYDGKEREFRGFKAVEQIEYGEPSSPTLKMLNQYDVGETHESRKGQILETATLDENGTLEPVSGVFQKTCYEIETRILHTGIDGQEVGYSFASRKDTFLYEGTTDPKQLRVEFDHDQYGNEIQNFDYGLVEGDNLAIGNDEILTVAEYEYRTDADTWMVDRPRLISQTDLLGGFVAKTRHTHDDRGNPEIEEQSPDGVRWIPVFRNTYDAYGNVTQVMDANDHYRTIVYDPTFHIYPVSETIHVSPQALIMTADYDPVTGKIVSYTDFNPHTTSFGYDTFCRLTHIVKPGDSAAYPTLAFEYHLNDPVSHVITRSREQFGEAGTYDLYAYFDGLGRKLQVRSEGEDGKWVVADATAFNSKQRTAKSWLPFFSNTNAYGLPNESDPHIAFQYDATGRELQKINPDLSFSKTVYLPLQKEVWDEEDTNSAGPHGNTPHALTYDGRERLVRVEEQNGPETYATQYGWDGLGNLVSILDQLNNLKTMVFDGMGRKTYMNDPDKGEMRYYHDDAGNVLRTVDNKSQEVVYTYDEANRKLTVSHNDVKARFHYDADLPTDHPDLENTLGRLSYVEDEAGRVCFSYDARGNEILKLRQADGHEFLLGMAYDAADRLKRFVYPDGHHVDYVYNDMNQLEAIPGYVANVDYNASAQHMAFKYGNGCETAYSYDIRQRLDTIKTNSRDRILQDLIYQYDTTSNITGITDQRLAPTPENQSRQFIYDDLYRLTRCSAPNWHIQYGYNSIGNLVEKTSDISDPKVNLGVLAYGEGNAGPHAVTRAGNFAYTYDSNGNLATKTGYAFQFDYADRMVAMQKTSGDLNATYQYGYDGNRVVKEVDKAGQAEKTIYIDKYAEVRKDKLISYVYAGSRRVARIEKPLDAAALISNATVSDETAFDADQNGVVTLAEIRARGNDPNRVELSDARDCLKLFKASTNPALLSFQTAAAAIAEQNTAGVPGEVVTRFYILDHLGSASIVTDRYGNVEEESVFYPYGMDRLRTGTFESEYRFTGKELDESGLHYFGARYFDSMVGRFVSPDPLFVESPSDDKQSLNLYAYSLNNPIIYTDSDGQFANLIFGAALGAGVEYASQVIKNRVEGKSWSDSFKKVDLAKIGIAAAAGAITNGASAVAGKVAVTAAGKVAGKMAVSAIGNVAEGALKARYGKVREKYTVENVVIDGLVGGASALGADAGHQIAQKTKGAWDLIYKAERLEVTTIATQDISLTSISRTSKSVYLKNQNYGEGKTAQTIQKVATTAYSKVIESNLKKNRD